MAFLFVTRRWRTPWSQQFLWCCLSKITCQYLSDFNVFSWKGMKLVLLFHFHDRQIKRQQQQKYHFVVVAAAAPNIFWQLNEMTLRGSSSAVGEARGADTGNGYDVFGKVNYHAFGQLCFRTSYFTNANEKYLIGAYWSKIQKNSGPGAVGFFFFSNFWPKTIHSQMKLWPFIVRLVAVSVFNSSFGFFFYPY